MPICAARPGFVGSCWPVQFFTPALFLDGAGYVSSVPMDRAKLPRASPLTGFTALDGRLVLVSPRCHTKENALLLAYGLNHSAHAGESCMAAAC